MELRRRAVVIAGFDVVISTEGMRPFEKSGSDSNKYSVCAIFFLVKNQNKSCLPLNNTKPASHYINCCIAFK